MTRARSAALLTTALLVAAAVWLVPTLFLRPWSIDHFYTRLFVQFAARRPMLLSQLRVLEPLGLRFPDDDLNDFSVAARVREAEWLERQLDILRSYDRERLPAAEQLSYDTVEWFLDDVVQGRPFMFHDFPVNQFTGIQSSLPEFMLTTHRIEDPRGARDYLARIGRFAAAFAQVEEGLALRQRRGIVPPRFVLRLVLRDMKELVAVEPERHPLYLHFATGLERLEPAPPDAAELLDRLRNELADGVYPAYRRLIDVLERLQRAAGDEVGVWRLPDGERFYAYTLRHHTTIEVSPAAVHRMGLAEVNRIEDEIRRTLRRAGLDDDEPAATVRSLGAEERFLYPEGEAARRRILADYRAIIDEIENSLGRFFELLPPVPVLVAAVPEPRQDEAPSAYYQLPPSGGSEPGTFFVNLSDVRQIRRFGMRALAYHEAIPGHHLQGTVAPTETTPLLRRILPLTAFAEGWALYAERLAAEHGFLDDPYDRLGHLQAELFRAVRLVVDTGIHDRRWTRERAIRYMADTTGLSRTETRTEVERQIVNPGQACAYKVGQLVLLDLRERARRRLGARFDLRRFHTAVLENGALPLSLLERVVDAWIEAELQESES